MGSERARVTVRPVRHHYITDTTGTAIRHLLGQDICIRPAPPLRGMSARMHDLSSDGHARPRPRRIRLSLFVAMRKNGGRLLHAVTLFTHRGP